MKLLIFSGTTEGRKLSRLLADRGAEVTVSVATDYGREEQGEYPGIQVLTGRLDQEAMEALLPGFDLCIDATHPYAVEATRTIRAACAAANVPYRRLLRSSGGEAQGIYVDSASQAAAYLACREGAVLLTTGAKELPAFSGLDPRRLYPRVLPTHEGLSACEAIGIPHRNILAMQGPFSQELNEALLHQYHIDFLVTKDGGLTGGFPEKIRATQAVGVLPIIIHRPQEDGLSFEAILTQCEEMIL